MKLSILIVNYNTEEHIAVLLAMLTQQTLAKNDFEIIITNNVQNTTLVTMADRFTEQLNIQIVQSEKNVGFGRANNMAAQHATGEHLLIMNPDIRMLQHDYLERLYCEAQQHADYGVITTQVLDDDNVDGSEFYSYEFNRTLGYEQQTCWFLGALLLMKPHVFRELGCFDPDFFMYCEDSDLCYRVKKIGLPLIKLNQLKVHHIGGSSEPNRGYDLHYRWYRSRLLFAYKHFSPEEFETLLHFLHSKSKKRILLYTILSLFVIQRFRSRTIQWRAMLDITERTIQESAHWLYFKP